MTVNLDKQHYEIVIVKHSRVEQLHVFLLDCILERVNIIV